MNLPKAIPPTPLDNLGAFAARELLRKRLGTGKFSFLLGMAFFAAVFVVFLFHILPLITLSIPLAGVLGFLFGCVLLLIGVVWSIIWALTVQLNLLVDDVATWVQQVLTQVVATLRQQFVSGVIIDLQVVETQVQRLVTAQTSNLFPPDSPLLPRVNEWAPIAAREGLRLAVMRVAGPLWSGHQVTLDTLEREAARLSIEETVASIRPWLRLAMGVVFVLGLLLAAIPVGIACGFAALL